MAILMMLVAAVSVGSKVDSVVVYPNQVMVVRNATVTVGGSGEVLFEDLPGALVDNSVRIKAPGMRIGEVQVRQNYLDEPTPTVRKLKDRVEELELELKKLANRQSVLEAKDKFLGSITLGAPELMAKELQQGRVSSESWGSALSFIGRELAAVKQSGLELAEERKDVEELLAAARKEYNDARSAIENRKDVSFSFEAGAGTYRVSIGYVIPYGASWVPYYELRALPDKNAVGLTYFARVTQATGEDWDRVKVVLSTTRPQLVLTAPEPKPWYLSLMDLQTYRSYNQAAQKKQMLAGSELEQSKGDMPLDGIFALPGAPPAESRAEVEETGISLQYVVPGRVSLTSGESAKKLQLEEAELAVEFGYLCVPRMKQQAFLTGKLVNTTDFVLLDGEASTYVGDEFTGTTWLDAAAPQESTEVSFGVDERVKVKRELVKSFKSTGGGLFGGKTERLQFLYRTTVENFRSEKLSIRVVEMVPVSQQKEIKVTVSKVEPPSDEQDKEKGFHTWTRIVVPQGKLEIDIEFTVEYPRGSSPLQPNRVKGLY
ncbi:mucoidy inhibitor MuiA family protein [candidate division WOR-3 bacterium]|nr:mucoidy inhibitor MuiA family protein [candidate division WOR-3 bacterium]